MYADYNFSNIKEPILISELLRGAGIAFGMPCGGRGVCGKCRVQVSGNVSAPCTEELRFLTPSELENGIRLACMTYALGDVSVSVMVDEYAVPDFEKQENKAISAKRLGAAVDVGTTTITAAVYDIDTDEMLFSKTALNPQGVFGADVISRMQKSLEGHADELQNAVCSAVSELLASAAAGVQFERTVITGNTAMLYLLTGRNPSSVTAAPFDADCLFGYEEDGKRLQGCDKLCDTVYLPRCASAFVGADITCCALDAAYRFDFLQSDGRARLLADIGTNGELMLSVKDRLYCCSTAAGPAFEGATLHSGSVAKAGAIDSVRYENGIITCSVIGNTAGKSICGSGAVDAVSVMLKAGILDDTGLILKEGHRFTEYITENGGVYSFTVPKTEVVITQEDIRNIQLAKSAVCAGMITLIDYAGLKITDIDELVLAGGFGGCINTKSAESIGLIPEGLAEKTVIAGNGALKGAHMLLNPGRRKETDKIAADSETVDLTSNTRFFDEYISGMNFSVD